MTGTSHLWEGFVPFPAYGQLLPPLASSAHLGNCLQMHVAVSGRRFRALPLHSTYQIISSPEWSLAYATNRSVPMLFT